VAQTTLTEPAGPSTIGAAVIASSYDTWHVNCGCGYLALDLPTRDAAESVVAHHCAATGHPTD
jgi:hypothetical protein